MTARDALKLSMLAAAVMSLAALPGCVFPSSSPKAMMANPANAAIDARHALLSSADDKDEFARANAIEALGLTAGADCGDTYLQALRDPSPAARFAAAMVVGDLKYEPAKPRLLKMADHNVEPDKGVFASVVYALYRMGDKDYTRDLGTLLFDNNEFVRAEVALVMGKMGHPSAIAPLKALRSMEQQQQRHPMVEIQVQESLAMLGDENSISSLESNARSSIYLDERVAAIRSLGAIQDRRGVYLLRDMVGLDQPVLVRLAASGALAQLGFFSKDGYEFCILALQEPNEVLRAPSGGKVAVKPEDASKVVTLAAIALGYMGKDGAVDSLLPILKSADGSARMAAAKSILMLLPAYMKAAPPKPPVSAQTAPVKPATPKSSPSPVPITPAPPATTKPKLITSGAKD